ncbi:MAG TPA: phosphatidate cytidylyltransferase [Tepidisphaeraceae bacterium]|jgi:phosphatidate cytidylyltransferase|nr:phosphatidate cytidylyltransferase [Tepidisphaeraceae bacterium]
MEASLRNRLTFGPLMLLGLFVLLGLDYAAQAWPALHVPTPRGDVALRGVGLLVLLILVLPIAVRELATLFAAEQVKPYRLIAAVGSGALVLHAFMTQFASFRVISTSVLAFIIVGVMLLAALRRAWGQQTSEAIHHMAGTVLATMYLGGLAWFILALRVKQSPHFTGTTITILMMLLVVKFTDIGAYFGGRAFGKHKLIPWLSPGKTWEGLFFGVLTAAAIGAACAPFIEAETSYALPWWKGAIFGGVIGGIGQLGDLLESMMKRDAEVKDSGRLVPGFGGILDIIDSPLLAAPFAYLLFSVF